MRILVFVFVSFLFSACDLFVTEYEIDNGEGIRFVWEEGLNDDPRYRLQMDANGYYHFRLYKETQNPQRITVRLERNGAPIYSMANGYSHRLEWDSDLYWWLLAGDTVANYTRTYFNPFTGKVELVTYPPIINWKDALVPTINQNSITDEYSGKANTVIAPIGIMRGDTMRISVRYLHTITQKERGSMFFTVLGIKELKDSIKIVLD